MNDTIHFRGRKWKLHSQTSTRLIFHPAQSPDASDLKGWRKRHNLNQRAAAARLGISQTHLAKIELGTRNCPPEILSRIK